MEFKHPRYKNKQGQKTWILPYIKGKEERKRMRVIEKLRKEHKISNGKKLNSLFFLQGKKRRR